MRTHTIALSWGKYGGFYKTHSRICLGRIALTWLPVEIDDLMAAYAEKP
jgi:hypothetical protein